MHTYNNLRQYDLIVLFTWLFKRIVYMPTCTSIRNGSQFFELAYKTKQEYVLSQGFQADWRLQ